MRRVESMVEQATGKEAGAAVASRILVVDDNPSMRRLIMRSLQREGHEILQAECADEALSICAEQGYRVDLLITDLVMPGMTGDELATKILEHSPSLSVLLMSGRDVGDGSIGEASFIGKPFTPDELVARVRELLA